MTEIWMNEFRSFTLKELDQVDRLTCPVRPFKLT